MGRSCAEWSRSNALRLAVAILSLMEHQRMRQEHQGRPTAVSRKSQPDSQQQHLRRTWEPRSPSRRRRKPPAGTNLTTTYHLLVQRHLDFECRAQRRRVRRPLGRGFHHLHSRGHRCGSGHRLGSRRNPVFLPTSSCIPSIDSVTVTGILLDGVPVQEPCLSQSQSMTLEAHAFSQGSDITSSVGPFTWSAQNPIRGEPGRDSSTLPTTSPPIRPRRSPSFLE